MAERFSIPLASSLIGQLAGVLLRESEAGECYTYIITYFIAILHYSVFNYNLCYFHLIIILLGG